MSTDTQKELLFAVAIVFCILGLLAGSVLSGAYIGGLLDEGAPPPVPCHEQESTETAKKSLHN